MPEHMQPDRYPGPNTGGPGSHEDGWDPMARARLEQGENDE